MLHRNHPVAREAYDQGFNDGKAAFNQMFIDLVKEQNTGCPRQDIQQAAELIWEKFTAIDAAMNKADQ
ncbi:MAG: hypothetical protein F6K55_03190 [Moorea sp. SIO4A3]|nr:hypothetical protein [Moorena sp. SIO4A3]